ncbi:hypothetical protein YC2023_101938 [Brassica napus]
MDPFEELDMTEKKCGATQGEVLLRNSYDVYSINSRHPGEVNLTRSPLITEIFLKPEICRGLKFECMEFRESILGVMPHHWDRREDTLLKLAHFRRHKRKILKKQAGKATISQTSGTHTSWNRLVEKDSKIDQEGCALCWLGNT